MKLGANIPQSSRNNQYKHVNMDETVVNNEGVCKYNENIFLVLSLDILPDLS